VREFALHQHPAPQQAHLPLLVEGGQSVLEGLRLRDILVRSFAVPSAWVVQVGSDCPAQKRCRL